MREDRYKSVLDNLYEGVYIVDRNRTIIYWNKGTERITGFKSDELIGQHCYDNILTHIDVKGELLCHGGCPLLRTIQDGNPREATVYLHHKDGQRLEVAVKTIPLFEDEAVVGAAELFIDDAEKLETNRTIDELKGLALFDPLTELPNRRFVDSFLDNRMNEFLKLGILFSVIMMDIDHFKRVNDTYGHDVGDRVLKMLAETLRGSFRKNDIVSRWGGEEFLAVIIGGTREDLGQVCEKVRSLVKNSSLRMEERQLSVTISIGASIVKAQDTLSALIKRADTALYVSKKTGRDKVTIL